MTPNPDQLRDGSFQAYFHHVEDLAPEITAAGFEEIQLLPVEGFAWMLPNLTNLTNLLSRPDDLRRALQLTEDEQSLLGVSPHVIAAAYAQRAETALLHQPGRSNRKDVLLLLRSSGSEMS